MTDKNKLKFDAIKRKGMKSIPLDLSFKKNVLIIDSKCEKGCNYTNSRSDFH